MFFECFSKPVVVEHLCLIAIQAYAELNRAHEVLPFITQVYNGLEDSPATIAQAWWVFLFLALTYL